MKIKVCWIVSAVIMLLQMSVLAETVAETAPMIKSGEETQNVTVAPNYMDAMEPDRTYRVNVSEWFENTENAKYHYSIDEKVSGAKLNEDTGDFSYRPWVMRIGQTLEFNIYAENEFGKSDDIKLSIYVDKMLGAPDAEFTLLCDTFYRNDNSLINDYAFNEELKIGGELLPHGNRILKSITDGKEYVYEKTYPLEEPTNYRLDAAYCNTLEDGKHTRRLVFTGGNDDDNKIYLGNQICKVGSDRCYGLAADESNLLVCEYGECGADPEIVIYKKRKS